MTQKAEDLRVRRTRKLLQRALIELTGEKGFADVTVRDLAERAMINRSTFYRHYLDKYGLLSDYIEGEVIELISPHEGETPFEEDLDRPPAGLVRILKHVQRNADFYRVMLGKKGDPEFCAQSFRQFIEEGFRRMLPAEALQADPGRPPIEFSVSYVLHAGIGAILWWLEKGQSYSAEQLAGWLNQLSMSNLSVSLGQNGKLIEVR